MQFDTLFYFCQKSREIKQKTRQMIAFINLIFEFFSGRKQYSCSLFYCEKPPAAVWHFIYFCQKIARFLNHTKTRQMKAFVTHLNFLFFSGRKRYSCSLFYCEKPPAAIWHFIYFCQKIARFLNHTKTRQMRTFVNHLNFLLFLFRPEAVFLQSVLSLSKCGAPWCQKSLEI